FDEIEIEENEREEKQNENHVGRTHPTQKQTINTRVAYHYAKNKQPTFRFPVIPDEQEKDGNNKGYKPNKSINRNRNQHSHRRKSSSKNVFKKDLENIPAYMRRQLEREKKEAEQRQIEKNKQKNIEDT